MSVKVRDNTSCDRALLWTKISRAALAETIRKKQMCISAVWIAAGINSVTQQKGYLRTYCQHSCITKHRVVSEISFMESSSFVPLKLCHLKLWHLALHYWYKPWTYCTFCMVSSHVFPEGEITYCPLKSYAPFGGSSYSCFALWKSFAY